MIVQMKYRFRSFVTIFSILCAMPLLAQNNMWLSAVKKISTIEDLLGKSTAYGNRILNGNGLHEFDDPFEMGGVEIHAYFSTEAQDPGSEMKLFTRSGYIQAVFAGYDCKVYKYGAYASDDHSILFKKRDDLKKDILFDYQEYNSSTEELLTFQSRSNSNRFFIMEVDKNHNFINLYAGEKSVLKMLGYFGIREKVLLDDNFYSNVNSWSNKETDDYTFYFQGGKYIITSKKGGYWFTTIPLNMEVGQDFEISFTVKKRYGLENYYFGMMLGRNTKSGHTYFAGISGNGYATFQDNGSTTKKHIELKTDAVNLGNMENRILLKKKDGMLTMYVNGIWVGQAVVTNLYGNYFGFEIFSGDKAMSVEFDNLLIKCWGE